MEELKIEPSEKLAYWVGVIQSDGSYYTYLDGKKTRTRIFIRVSPTSLPMLTEVKTISEKIFAGKCKIFKGSFKGFTYYSYHIEMKKFLDKIKELDIDFKDPPKPPKWALSQKTFGAYLAGLIDGDGSVRIKRGKYESCSIRIFTTHSPRTLRFVIKSILGCRVRLAEVITRSMLFGNPISGKCYEVEFYISAKTYKFFLDFILPYLKIGKKRAILEEFIKRYERGVVDGGDIKPHSSASLV